MKVNINDIEDIIIAKIEIDKNNPNIEGRSPLQNFINTYCEVKWLLMYKELSIPFEIKTIFDNEYIFYSCDNKEEQKILFEFLDKINNNIKKLTKIPNIDLINNELLENSLYVIMNNSYYKL